MNSVSPSSDALRWLHAHARQADPHLGALHALKDPLRVPRYLRMAIRGIAEYGRLAEELWGVSPRRQFLMYLPLFQRFGHTIDEFYYYRLCTPEWRPHAPAFLPWRRMRALDRLYGGVGIDVALLEDKARFARHCAEVGLPSIPTILEFDRNGGFSGETTRDGRLPDGPIVVKPRLGMGGENVVALERVPGGYRDRAGRVMEAQELIAMWRKQSRERPMIVQARIQNAHEVAPWSTGALCTVRLVTTRAGNGAPVPLLGLLRMPTTDTVVDNILSGGILATVDLESGELGPARTFNIAGAMQRRELRRHPTTGKQIAGCRLPCWSEIIQLALRAHEKFGGFHSIGWDVAITDNGLVLIEGNHDWGVRIAQFPGPLPLGSTRLPEDIRHCFDKSATRPGGPPGKISSHAER